MACAQAKAIFETRPEPDGMASAVTLAIIFLPFAAGYFISYLFRLLNGPLAVRLADTYGLGPGGLGLLTAAYFLTFAAFQIPAGCLIDRFGPRRTQAALLLVATAGSVMSAAASGYWLAVAGRALIGLGCSGAFVTGVKMISLRLPPTRRAMGTSCLVMCGGLGAITSTMPVEFVAEQLDLRAVFGLLAIATLTVAVLVWRLVPAQLAPGGGAQAVLPGLRAVLRDRRFWRMAPLSGALVGSAFAIHGLWAARYLTDVARFSTHDVNVALLGMGLTLTFGALLLGDADDRAGAAGREYDGHVRRVLPRQPGAGGGDGDRHGFARLAAVRRVRGVWLVDRALVHDRG